MGNRRFPKQTTIKHCGQQQQHQQQQKTKWPVVEHQQVVFWSVTRGRWCIGLHDSSSREREAPVLVKTSNIDGNVTNDRNDRIKIHEAILTEIKNSRN